MLSKLPELIDPSMKNPFQSNTFLLPQIEEVTKHCTFWNHKRSSKYSPLGLNSKPKPIITPKGIQCTLQHKHCVMGLTVPNVLAIHYLIGKGHSRKLPPENLQNLKNTCNNTNDP